jgi:hypothetical protein
VIAGTVEGFISPSHIQPAVKFLLAGALATLLTLYLTKRPSGDRGEAKAPPASTQDPSLAPASNSSPFAESQ